MGAARRLGAGAALVLTLGLWASGGVGPDDPHAYMEVTKRCTGCHRAQKEGEDWVLDPHVFTVSANEICGGCHSAQQMGRSHPVGSDPLRVLHLERLPAELPLQSVDGDREEVMTCGTCHNPHQPRLSKQKLHSRQSPYPGRPGLYLTYYLRMRGQDPRDGFTPLCHSCHPKR